MRVRQTTCVSDGSRAMPASRLVLCGGLMLSAHATPAAESAPIPGPATDLYPATREYQWTVYIPRVTTERREIVVSGPVVTVRSRRYDYEVPGLREERRKLWQVPEFHCKYPDWQLPNECGVEWRTAYADFPQLTMRREHIDVDVAEWSSGEQRIFIDVPRVTWVPRDFTLVVPVLQTEPPEARPWVGGSTLPAEASLQQARRELAGSEAAARVAVENALGTVERSIATVEAQGGDASKLQGSDGTALDLASLRQALVDGKAVQVERYARIRAELDAAGQGPEARGAP